MSLQATSILFILFYSITLPSAVSSSTPIFSAALMLFSSATSNVMSNGMIIFFTSIFSEGSGELGSGDSQLLKRSATSISSTSEPTTNSGSGDLGSGDSGTGDLGSGDLGSGDVGAENKDTPLLTRSFPDTPLLIRSFPEMSSTSATTSISSTSEPTTNSGSGDLGSGDSGSGDLGSGDLGSGDVGAENEDTPLLTRSFPDTPLLIRSFPEISSTSATTSISSTSEPTTNPGSGDLGSKEIGSILETQAVLSTLATVDVTSVNLGGMNIPPSILGTIVVLGVVSATLMMILIIISITYAKKQYRKRTGHYKRHHMYDLPKYMVKPPPLPPRKVFPLVNKSTFLESSSKEILITAAESTFVLKNDYGQGDHTPGERYCKNENSEIRSGLSRHMYKNTMAGMSEYRNETHGPVLANTPISSSITEHVSEPITSQIATSDPQTNESTSKELSTYEQAQLYTAESPHFDTAADHENTCDHESYTEHQPYERSSTYQNAQPCDSLLRLNKEAQSQDSVLSEASKHEFDDNSGIIAFTDLCMDIENAHDHESGSQHESHEKVYSHEKVQPCDVKDVLLHLNQDAQHQDPSVLGEASKNESNNDSGFSTIIENTHDHESDSEHESYEKVCPYEKVQPCDVKHSLLHLNKELQSSVLSKVSKNESNDDCITEFTESHIAIETTRDSESSSEHESYEEVYSYEKVQPCDVEKLLHNEAHQQVPSVRCEASNKGYDSDSDGETSPAESINSYEQVWGYERIHHCDLPLEPEEFMVQKDDNTAFIVANTNDN